MIRAEISSKGKVLNAPSPSQLQFVVGIASLAVSTASKMPGILWVQDALQLSKNIRFYTLQAPSLCWHLLLFPMLGHGNARRDTCQLFRLRSVEVLLQPFVRIGHAKPGGNTQTFLVLRRAHLIQTITLDATRVDNFFHDVQRLQ